MPEFATPYSGTTLDRPMTKQELIRAIRYAIAAEYEAIQLYMQIAEAADDELATAVLKDIAEEEVVHAGEFLTLLTHLAPEEKQLYDEGAGEVREMMEKLGIEHEAA